MKFILLHEGKNDEGIRAFFQELWELYVKVGRLPSPVAIALMAGCSDYAESVSHCTYAGSEWGL